MKKALLLVFILSVSKFGATQQYHQSGAVYQLSQLIDSALQRYPLHKQHQLLTAMQDISNQNLNAAYLPQLQLNGQMSYQSDVAHLALNLPGLTMPELNRDWYKLHVDVSQMIFDGGTVKKLKSLDQQGFDAKKNELLLQENAFKEVVSKLYFRALLLQEQQKIFNSSIRALNAVASEMDAAVRNGMVLISTLNALQVDKLRLQQQLLEVNAALTSTLSMLSIYCGINFDSTNSLAIPQWQKELEPRRFNRPEYRALTLQQERNLFQKQLLKAKRLPAIQAFTQIGYGRPSYNILDNNFSHYYMIGLRFNYKIWDWNVQIRELKLIDMQSAILETNKETFILNQTAAEKSHRDEIAKFAQLISLDTQIIELQLKVLKNVQAALQSGTITASAYMLEFEKLIRAEIARETNKIKRISAMADLMFINGNISFNE